MKRDKRRRKAIIFQRQTVEHFIGSLVHLHVTERRVAVVTLVDIGVFKVCGRPRIAARVRHMRDGLEQVVSIDRLSRI